jgi:hypothetical protein
MIAILNNWRMKKMKVLETVQMNIQADERIPFHLHIDDDCIAVTPMERGRWGVVCEHASVREGEIVMCNEQVEQLIADILISNQRRYCLKRDYDADGNCIGFGYYAKRPNAYLQTHWRALKAMFAHN